MAMFPEGNLLPVMDEGSDDLAIIRTRTNANSLLTLVAVGDKPRDVAVKLF
jgi:YVTN family beta-propeller protein